MPEEVRGLEREPSLEQYAASGKHLGTGGQGSVYRYVHRRTGNVFAAKVLYYDEEAEETDGAAEAAGNVMNILREQYAAPRYKHAHLIKAHAVFKYPDVGWVIIMPYYQQGSLSRVNLQPHQVKDAIRQILEALRHLHEHGHIHRDIKPGNVLVRNRPEEPLDLVVADYGLISLRNPVTACGTTGFTAPEVWRNNRFPPGRKPPYQNAADIYSLGILILRLLRISVPHINIQSRGHHKNHIKAHLDEALEACEGNDIERQDILAMAEKMLQFDPKDRPSAHDCLQLTELVPTTPATQTSTRSRNVPITDSPSQGSPAINWWNSSQKPGAEDQKPAKKQGRNDHKISGGRYGLRKRNSKQYGPCFTPKSNKVTKNQASSLLTPRVTPKGEFDALKTRKELQSPAISKHSPLSKSWDKMDISD